MVANCGADSPFATLIRKVLHYLHQFLLFPFAPVSCPRKQELYDGPLVVAQITRKSASFIFLYHALIIILDLSWMVTLFLHIGILYQIGCDKDSPSCCVFSFSGPSGWIIIKSIRWFAFCSSKAAKPKFVHKASLICYAETDAECLQNCFSCSTRLAQLRRKLARIQMSRRADSFQRRGSFKLCSSAVHRRINQLKKVNYLNHFVMHKPSVILLKYSC